MTKRVDRITIDMNATRLQEDLKRYKAKALELGASRAAIVRVHEIPAMKESF